MSLTQLLQHIENERGGVTVAGLARRLDTTPAQITAMLAALRAAGRLAPEVPVEVGDRECSESRTCSAGPCPGPSDCPFVVRFGSMLEVK